jgi:endo-1,4-beta-xylanase
MKFMKPYLAGLALAVPGLVATISGHTQAAPLAQGHDKFLGGIYAPSQLEGFENYFNQVVAENSGKWGAIANNTTNPLYFPEDYSDAWFTAAGGSWHGGLDESFNFAKDNNLPYRMHVLIWGNQQPRWIVDLDPEDQLTAITAWFDVVAARYSANGGFDFIEVVNEPVNDAPDQPDSDNEGGNYINALGGTGETGWDWVITSFEMARERFPAEAKLMINEYNVLSSANVLSNYLHIIDLLIERELIDAVGIQGHAFSTQGSSSAIRNHLDQVAERGLPIYITEMDIDGPNDRTQLEAYRRIFPIFWEHPAVEGVTLWGFRPGLWREDAHLVRADNSERPAMSWLRCYLDGLLGEGHPGIVPGQTFSLALDSTSGHLVGQVLDCFGEDSSETDGWHVQGGTGQGRFDIGSNGNITLAGSGNLAQGDSFTLQVVARTGTIESAPQTVTIHIGPSEGRPSAELPKGSSGGSVNGLFLLILALLGGMRWMLRRH